MSRRSAPLVLVSWRATADPPWLQIRAAKAGLTAVNSLNGGPFNVSIRNLQREFALSGKIPPYSAPPAFGRFEVLHQVGAGMLGPVFLARDPDRTRSVAVKVFRLDITPEQAAELASQLGALARANLAHPSIIAPFEAGIEGTVAYMAEDYVPADSLDAAIRQYGPAPVSQAIRILAAVAGALDFAAAVGVYHGALHPRDLLVTPDDTRVTGLGVGRALEAVGLRAPMRRPYVAPERVQREGWDARADVYSLGVLTRELLGGRAKPDASSEVRLPDSQAERLQPLIARATAARPADRFSTCLEFIGAVQEALAGAPTRAATPIAANAGRDLLLPLEGEESAEASPDGAGRLRLEPSEAPYVVPDVLAADAVTKASALPDLDLRSPSRRDEPPVDSFDLSDLDSQLAAEPGSPEPELPPAVGMEEHHAQAAAFDSMPGVSIGGPRTAELGEPIDLPLPEGDADRPGRFADVFPTPAEPASEPIAEAVGETIREEPVVALPPPVERPSFGAADFSRTHMPARRQSRAPALLAMLIVGLVIGAVAGYLVGARQSESTVSPPPIKSTPTPVPGLPATGPPATPAARPAAPVAQPPTTAATLPSPASPAVPKTTATGKGVLDIRSTPRGAVVSINNRPRGVTPLRVRNLAPGRYTVRVTRRGYASEEREVSLTAERPSSTITFSLDRASGAQRASRSEFFGLLSVESLPSGARVFVDGALVGTTPLADARVAAGSHVVRVDRVGFRPWTSPIQVVTDQRLRVTASLERELR